MSTRPDVLLCGLQRPVRLLALAAALASTQRAPAQTVQFEWPTQTVAESSGTCTVRLVKSSASNTPSAYLSLTGTAILAVDYDVPDLTAAAHLAGVTQLTATAGDQLGAAVAGLGMHILVAGVPGFDDPASGTTNAGAVNLYVWDGERPALVAVVTNPAPAAGDVFGSAVAAAGTNRFLVGAYADSAGAPQSGAAYLYEWNGSAANLLAVLTNPAPATGDAFGFAVAAQTEDRFLIGAFGDQGTVTRAGTVHLYVWNGSAAEWQGAVTNPVVGAADWFGYAVTGLGSNHFVVGARADAGPSVRAGVAYRYAWTGGVATLVAAVTNPAPADDQRFADSLAAGPDGHLAIGAPGDPRAGPDAGAVYVYRQTGTVIKLLGVLPNPEPAPGDAFGSALTWLRTNVLAVGAWHDGGPAGATGGVHLYDVRGTNLLLRARLYPPDGVAGDEFGRAVAALGEERLAVGARGADAGAPDAGQAQVYAVAPRLGLLAVALPGALTSLPVRVAISNDSLSEVAETVVMSLDGLLDGTPGSPTNFTLTIASNDAPPSLAPVQVLSVGSNAADVYSAVLGSSFPPNLARGFVYHTNSPPTLAHGRVTYGGGFAGFVGSLTGLQPETRYYVRAYASNLVGLAYSSESVFTTRSFALPSVRFRYGSALIAESDPVFTGTLSKSAGQYLTSGELRLAGSAELGSDYSLSNLTFSAQLITAGHPAPSNAASFGASMARLGPRHLLVGAPLDGAATGAAILYEWSPHGPLYRTTVTNPAAGSDHFGTAVASLGTNLLLVGAPRADAGATDAGAAYLFAWNGTNTTLLAVVSNPSPDLADGFGATLAALSGNRFLVGAPDDDSGGSDAGVAHVFTWNGTAVVAVATLVNPDPLGAGRFGATLAALPDQRFVIGVPGSDAAAVNSGVAHLYDGSAVVPVLLGTITNPSPAVDDAFGIAVAGLSPDRFLVGAAGDDAGATNAGAAYLYALTNGGAVLVSAITNPTPARDDGFGSALAGLEDQRFAVGCERADLGATNSGAVHFYLWNGDRPVWMERRTNPQPGLEDHFGGVLLEAASNVCAVAARYDTMGATNGGAVHFFRLAGATNGVCFALPGSVTSMSFMVQLTNDIIWEPEEDVSFGNLGSRLQNGVVGSPSSFTLTISESAGLPRATTFPFAGINGASVHLEGDVVHDGALPITSRGFVLSTFRAPTIADDQREAGSGSGLFDTWIAVLPETHYYFRAYASNAAGVAYGDVWEFTSGPSSPADLHIQIDPPAWSTPEVAATTTVRVVKSLTYGLVSGEIATAPIPGTPAAQWGADYTLKNTAQPFQPVAIASNPVPVVSNLFGWVMAAIHTNRFVVTSPKDDTGATNGGAAWVYELREGLPIPVALLTSPTPKADDNYGYALTALDTDRFAVGAPMADSGVFTNTGCVFVYGWSGSNAVLLAVVTNPAPAANDRFGMAVAQMGTNYLLVGADWDDRRGTDGGEAYLYDCHGTSAVLLAIVTNPSTTANAGFGATLSALASNRFLVAAPQEGWGTVYGYEWNGVQATRSFTLSNPGGSQPSFGRSLCALSESRFAVGAPSNGPSLVGQVYLYELLSTTAVLRGQAPHPSSTQSDNFGLRLTTLSTNRFAVGEPWHDGGGPLVGNWYDSGACHLYEWNGTQTVRLVMLTNEVPIYIDQFGMSAAALGSEWLLVAATEERSFVNTPAYPGAGRFHLYHLGATATGRLFTLNGEVRTNKFEMAIIPDGLQEPTEYARLVLTNLVGGRTGVVSHLELEIFANPGQPAVFTDPVGSIGASTALVSGLVVSNGGAAISGRGFVYGTNSNPTVGGRRVEVSGDTGPFAATLAHLRPGTPHFVRAYASNAVALVYGNQQAFTTATAAPPAVITGPVGSTGLVEALVWGEVLEDRGDPVRERGFLFGTSTPPSATSIRVIAGSGTGLFNSALSDLSPATRYRVVAYASNGAGIAYGDVLTFDTTTAPWPAVHFHRAMDWMEERSGRYTVTVSKTLPFQLTAGAIQLSGTAVYGDDYQFASMPAWALAGTATSPPPAASFLLGLALAPLGSNRFVAGGPGASLGGSGAGAAHLYEVSPTGLLYLVTVTNPTPVAGDAFGSSLASLDAHRFVVGVCSDDVVTVDSGAAHLYEYREGALTHLAAIANPTPDSGDLFGWSVAALSTNLVLIGARNDDLGFADAGVVHLFGLDGAMPQLLATLTNPLPALGSRFGLAIAALDERRFVVGLNSQRTYLYEWDGAAFLPLAAVTNAVDVFVECAVAGLASNRFAVGLASDDTGASNAGAVHLFEWDGTSAVRVATVTNPTPVAGDAFGNAVVRVSPTRFVVGTRYDDLGAEESGTAYLYEWTNGPPALIGVISNPTPATSDQFATALAPLPPGRVLIGAPRDDLAGADAGAVHLYQIAAPPQSLLFSLPGAVTSVSYTLEVAQDGIAEPDEEATMTLTDLSGGTADAPASFTLTIASNTAIPVVETGPVLSTGAFSVVAGGIVWSDGDSPVTDRGFVYGLGPQPTHADLHAQAGSGTGTMSATLSGLAPTTTYFVRAYASNVAGLAYGLAQSFVTTSGWPSVRFSIAAATRDERGGALTIAVEKVERYLDAQGEVVISGTAAAGDDYSITVAAPRAALVTVSNPTPSTVERFGISLANWTAQRVLAGAEYSTRGGRVYALDVSASNVIAAGSLTNPAGLASENFGCSVAALGSEFVVVGCSKRDTPQVDAGVAYLYQWDGTNDMLHAVIQDPDPSAEDLFGQQVCALDERFFLVAGLSSDQVASNAGALFLYAWDNLTLSAPIVVGSPHPAPGTYFGSALATMGPRRFAAGEHDSYFGALAAGLAHVFDWDGTQVTYRAQLAAPQPQAYDRFGTSVAGLSSNLVLVGSPGTDLGGTDAGAVFLFDCSGQTTQLLAVVTNPVPTTSQKFGESLLAVTPNRFAVRSTRRTSSTNEMLHIFDWDGSQATLVASLLNPQPLTDNHLGEAMAALTPTRLLVAAPYEKFSNRNVGAVYVYQLRSTAQSIPFALFGAETRADFVIDLVDDGLAEPNEYAILSFTNLVDTHPAAPDQFTLTIAASMARVAAETLPPLAIGPHAATLQGIATVASGSVVSGRGFILATSTPPTLAGTWWEAGNGTGLFTLAVGTLPPSTRHYVQAYASNAAGLVNGTVQTFDTTAAALPEVRFADAGAPLSEGTAHTVTVYKTQPYQATYGMIHLAGAASNRTDYRVSPAGAKVNLAEVTQPIPTAGAEFGHAVAVMAEDLFAVGAPRDHGPAPDAGTVHLFRWSDGACTAVGIVTAATPTAGAHYGGALAALPGNLLVIGASGADGGAPQAGAVYLVQWAGSNSVPLATITHPDPEAGLAFGAAVAAAGPGAFLVGSPGHDHIAMDQGAAYLFTWDGSNVVQRAALDHAAPQQSDAFGAAVAAWGTNLLLVGAPARHEQAPRAGSVCLFAMEATSTVLRATLANPAPASGSGFGSALAVLDPDTFLVGAPADTEGAAATAAAYVFDWNGTSAVLRTTLTPPLPGPAPGYGAAFAILASNRFAIGAPAGTAGGSGVAYVYQCEGDQVAWVGTFTNPTPASGDAFGTALAPLAESVLLVGEPGDDRFATNAGTAQVLAYAPAAGQLLFHLPGGVTSTTFTIEALLDGLAEPDESVVLTLTQVVGGVTTAPAETVLLIASNGAAASVETDPVLAIGTFTAQVSGVVSAEGGSSVTQRGFRVSTGDAPALDAPRWPAGSGTGVFSAVLTGLQPFTRYTVQAYACNDAGEASGSARTFTTAMPPLPEVGLAGTAATVAEDSGSFTVTVFKTLPYYIPHGELNLGGTATRAVDYGLPPTAPAAIVATVPPPQPAPSAHFGHAVAALGSPRFAVGAPFGGGSDAPAGAVHIYDWTNGQPLLVSAFTNPAPAAGDAFGSALAGLTAHRLLVAAEMDSGAAPRGGSVYLLACEGTNTAALAVITNPLPAADARFGSALAVLATNRFVVGAAGAGFISLYEEAAGTPALLAIASNPAAASPAGFGVAMVALDPTRILVGAAGAAETNAPGTVHLYAWDGLTLTPRATITNPAPAAGDSFGAALATLDTNHVVICAFGHDGAAVNEGRAYLFQFNGDTPVLIGTLTNPAPSSYDFFGWSVAALATNRFVIGAYGDPTGPATAGSAYLYGMDNGSPAWLGVLTNPAPASGDFFASALAALAPAQLLVGAVLNDESATDAGAVYVASFAADANSLFFTLPHAVTSASFVLSLTNDAIAEGMETVTFNITNLKQATIGVPATFLLTIADLLLDEDGDGLPSAWEILYGLDPGTSNAPGSNVDGDWMTDLEEFIADTNPTNPVSFLADLALTNLPTSGTAIRLEPTSTGRLYGLQWTTNLAGSPPLWLPYGPERTGSGATLLFTLTNDAPVRAYRGGVRIP